MRELAFASLLAIGCYDIGALDRSVDAGAALAGGGWQPVASPAIQALRGVSGSATGDVFAVGASSAIVRLGASATPASETAPPGYNLRAVWAGDSAVLAVGDSEVVLTRGSAGWAGASLGDPSLYAVTGLPDGSALAAGSGGTIVHQSATGWSAEDSGVFAALHGVWVRPSGDVIVVGEAGTVLHGTGNAPLSWTADASTTTVDLFGVFATATDAWVVGSGGLILHAASDGAWAREASGTTADLFAVFGAGDRVWAVGAGGTIVRRSGSAWTTEHAGGADLRAVWVSMANEAWAVGDEGAVLVRKP
jgi:hypothetical protein